MADAENNVITSDDTTQVEEKQVVQKAEEPKQDAAVTELEAKIAKLQKDLDNARKGEKYAKSTREELAKRVEELEAQGDWKAKFEALNAAVTTEKVNNVLANAAKEAKAKDINAVLKLVDKSAIKVVDGQVDTKAVEAAIAQAKKEFAILFEEQEIPKAGRAAEGDVTSGYEKEIRAAKSIAEIEAVMKRYNKA